MTRIARNAALLPFPVRDVPPMDRLSLAVPACVQGATVAVDLYEPADAARVRVRSGQTALRLANGGLVVVWMPNEVGGEARFPVVPWA